MFTFIRQSTQQLRLWLIAAAAVLALTSILEAGHVHGVFTQTDDQCTLCQHSVALDKVLSSIAIILIPLLLTVAVGSLIKRFIPAHRTHFALIRAPPAQAHTH
jgi:small-conductance mechanosensitive channel